VKNGGEHALSSWD